MTTSSRALDVDIAQVLAIPPLDLRPNDRNQRHEDADIADLVASIPVIGILQPLIVLPADADGLYTVVAGHRRRVDGCWQVLRTADGHEIHSGEKTSQAHGPGLHRYGGRYWD